MPVPYSLTALPVASLLAYFLKVKAHSGVFGNDRTDAAASAARTCVAAGSPCDVSVSVGCSAYSDVYWLSYQHTAPDGTVQTRHVANLHSDVKAVVHPHVRHGFHATDGAYYASYCAAQPSAYPGTSSLYNTNCRRQHTFAETKVALQVRTGRLRTNTVLHQMRRSCTAACPLCDYPSDNVGHALGSCPLLRGAYINRHNSVARSVHAAVIA